MSKIHKTFSALQDAVRSARDDAQMEARKACSKGFFRSRGVWMTTQNDKQGLVPPLAENYHLGKAPTAAQLNQLIADVEKNYPMVDSITFEGGFDYASKLQDFREGEYDPWVSDWSVEVWRRWNASSVDDLVRNLTGFTSLSDMVNSHPGYRPTIATTRGKDARECRQFILIADAYDAAQAARGDARRAFRN